MKLPHRNSYGIVTRRELLTKGNGPEQVAADVAAGTLTSVRRDLFARRGSNANVVAALKLGGRLTCAAALRFHNSWSLDSDLHVHRSKSARYRLKAPDDVHDCRPFAVHGHNGAVDDVLTALSAVLRCHGPEDAVVALDGARHHGLVSESEVKELLSHVGARKRPILARADGLVASPLESVVRHRLAGAKIRVRAQVEIEGVGRVDFLVGDLLIVETDGFEFHADKETFTKDRGRDRRAAALGYRTIRITWDDVHNRWEKVLADVRALVRARRHLDRRQRRGVVG